MSRCPRCYRRLDAAHAVLGRCPMPAPEQARKPAKSRAGYVPPCRAGRPSRAEYDAERASTPEQKRLLTNARAARYRARKAAA